VTIKWIIAPMLPRSKSRTIILTCLSTSSCPSFGKRSPVTLEPVAPGVLARPNFICADCLMELALVTEKEEIHG
jgi:hypothetical protein